MENGVPTLKGLGQLMFWRKRRKNNQSFLFKSNKKKAF